VDELDVLSKQSDLMKQKFLLTITAIICSVVGITIFNYVNRERLFYDHAFVQLKTGSGNEPMKTIILDSGELVSVILQHACCSGAGFDAVAIRTSDGQEFSAKKNYCGLEGFSQGLGTDADKDLKHFTEFLMTQGYQKRQREQAGSSNGG